MSKSVKILPVTPDNIRLCAQELTSGRIVGVPTETVYGLAAMCTDADALTKIYKAKDRPTFDPLIVHVSLPKYTLAELLKEGVFDPETLSDLAIKRTDQLIRAFWPGPLTLVLPKSEMIPDLATSGLPTVAIRAPSHPVMRTLIERVEVPLCAPSANRFGRLSPTTAADVAEELGDRISYILDGGPCEIGLESTILLIQPDGQIRLLRPGGLAVDKIEAVLGTPILKSEETAKGAAQAPGMLSSHYSPQKRLILLPSRLDQMMSPPVLGVTLPKKIALLAMKGKAADQAEILSEIFDREAIAESLSETGNWDEAAKTFFSKLRALDHSDAELILAEPCEETQGLGFAIADRLKRAAAPKA